MFVLDCIAAIENTRLLNIAIVLTGLFLLSCAAPSLNVSGCQLRWQGPPNFWPSVPSRQGSALGLNARGSMSRSPNNCRRQECRRFLRSQGQFGSLDDYAKHGFWRAQRRFARMAGVASWVLNNALRIKPGDQEVGRCCLVRTGFEVSDYVHWDR